MYDKRIRYALDNFILEDYFLDIANEYHLKEEKDSGKSDLHIKIRNENLCIYDFDSKKKCNFLRENKRSGMKKSVDHLLFRKENNYWTLHMIEMKKSVGNKTWIDIKQKMRTSYLNALALSKVLGIEVRGIYAYTTYEDEKFESIQTTPNPKIHVPLLGVPMIDFKRDEWDKNKITIDVGEKIDFEHMGIKMNRSSDGLVLEGELCL